MVKFGNRFKQIRIYEQKDPVTHLILNATMDALDKKAAIDPLEQTATIQVGQWHAPTDPVWNGRYRAFEVAEIAEIDLPVGSITRDQVVYSKMQVAVKTENTVGNVAMRRHARDCGFTFVSHEPFPTTQDGGKMDTQTIKAVFHCDDMKPEKEIMFVYWCS